MKIEQFNTVMSDLHSESTDLLSRLIAESGEVSAPSISTENEAAPNDLTLDTVVFVSQELKSGEVKKFEFVICDVWLKKNIWTIVNIKKEREEKNFWILFFDNGTYYLKKGIKGPIAVHVHLKFKKED